MDEISKKMRWKIQTYGGEMDLTSHLEVAHATHVVAHRNAL